MSKKLHKTDKGIEQAASFLSGLASINRLHLLCCIADGEKNVTELIQETGIAQTSVSQHLNKLKEEGIVTFRREHRTLYYRIIHPLTFEIMQLLHAHYCTKKGHKK